MQKVCLPLKTFACPGTHGSLHLKHFPAALRSAIVVPATPWSQVVFALLSKALDSFVKD